MNADTNANANANVENESVPVLIGANAITNAIELTKDIDVQSQIGSKKDIAPCFATAYSMPDTACKGS